MPALLAGFTSSFMFFFFGVFEIFYGNREEFLFRFRDFGLWTTLIAFSVMALVTLLILFLPKIPSRVVFGVATWVSVMGYIQSIFLNGSGSLSQDSGGAQDTTFLIIDAAIWIISGVIIIGAALLIGKIPVIRPVLIITLITLLVMLITSSVIRAANAYSESGNVPETPSESGADTEEEDDTDVPVTSDASDDTEINPEDSETGIETETETEAETEAPVPADPGDVSSAYLTSNGLDQVSKKNIIIFIIDRFDVKYYNRLIKKDPEIMDFLDGFTYFSDNISLYSRTYPAVPSMISGINMDFDIGAEDYFLKAYQASPFLNDLKNNGYAVKIYTQNFYCYRNGIPLYGIADNLSVTASYKITDRASLVSDMIKLSAYRYLPTVLKELVDVSSASFSGIVSLDGDGKLYELYDPVVCGQLKKGISLDENEKSYTFIHLSGCHSPYSMDENCNYAAEPTLEGHLKGCLNMIESYIKDLKRLGVYDDSTIVITGDHPSAVDDHEVPSQPRLTALFVKPENSHGALKTSKAQVSQENLIPTLVKSAGIETEHDYGPSYFEVPEGKNQTRYHRFQLSIDSNTVTQIVTMEITGDGTDFSNWKVKSREDIGAMYK